MFLWKSEWEIEERDKEKAQIKYLTENGQTFFACTETFIQYYFDWTRSFRSGERIKYIKISFSFRFFTFQFNFLVGFAVCLKSIMCKYETFKRFSNNFPFRCWHKFFVVFFADSHFVQTKRERQILPQNGFSILKQYNEICLDSMAHQHNEIQ